MALTISATDTEVQKPINVIYEQTLLRNAIPQACYFSGSTPGMISKQRGSATISWRRYNTSADDTSGIAPTTTALTELTSTAAYGQGRDSSTVHFSNVTATVAKYGAYYILNEEVELFNFSGDMDGIFRTMGITAGRSANFLHRNTLEDGVTLRYAGNVASAGLVNSIVSVDLLDRVINELARNYAMPFTAMARGSETVGTVPLLPGYWAFCHPDVARDVAKLTGFVSAKAYGSYTDLAPGEFGAYEGAGYSVRFIQTAEASIDADAGTSGGTDVRSTGGTNADLYTIVIKGMDADGSVGLGEQWGDGVFRVGEGNPAAIEIIPGGRAVNAPATPADPYKELSTLAFKLWYGGAILNANWCRGIKVAATNLSN